MITTLPDKEAVAERAAALLRETSGNVVLAGGSTPKRAYELASGTLPSNARYWLGDERMVGADDERSNLAMARATLGAEIEAVRTDLPLAEAAADYDARLRAAGPIDLVLLGLGPDAHTSSLFPGKPWPEGCLVGAVPEAGMEPYVARVTLTLEAINAARRVIFLVAGQDKAEALERAFGDPPDPASPAAHVRPAEVLAAK